MAMDKLDELGALAAAVTSMAVALRNATKDDEERETYQACALLALMIAAHRGAEPPADICFAVMEGERAFDEAGKMPDGYARKETK